MVAAGTLCDGQDDVTTVSSLQGRSGSRPGIPPSKALKSLREEGGS